jgi:hypothetical protein
MAEENAKEANRQARMEAFGQNGLMHLQKASDEKLIEVGKNRKYSPPPAQASQSNIENLSKTEGT